MTFSTTTVCLNALKNYPVISQLFTEWKIETGFESDQLEEEFEKSNFADCDFVQDEELLTDGILKNLNTNRKSIFQILSLALHPTVDVRSLFDALTVYETLNHIKNDNSLLWKKVEKTCTQLIENAINVQQTVNNNNNNNNNNVSENPSQDILTIIYMGYKNENFPLLLYLCDVYHRCRFLHYQKYNKILLVKPFFKRYCRNPQFMQLLEDSKHLKFLLETAVDTACKRLMTPVNLRMCEYRINDNIDDYLNYMFGMLAMVKNEIQRTKFEAVNESIPFQMDFQIIPREVIHSKDKSGIFTIDPDPDDDPDEEEDDYKQQKSIPENPPPPPPSQITRQESTLPTDIGLLLEEHGIHDHITQRINIGKLKFQSGSGARCKRRIAIIDLRQEPHMMSIFAPKKTPAFLDPAELVHISMINSTSRETCPAPQRRDGQAKHFIGGSSGLNGQMFIVSWHVLAADDIRCYVYFRGCVSRFYGEDIYNVWAKHYFVEEQLHKFQRKFDNQSFIDDAWIPFCNAFANAKFDKFYEGITGKKREIINNRWLADIKNKNKNNNNSNNNNNNNNKQSSNN